MKRLIALILVCALLAGCTPQVNTDNSTDATTSTTQPQQYAIQEIVPEFANLDDVDLLTYVEDQVYTNLVHELDNEAYFVENVSAVYISKEYLEEVAYNSQENIYFGFTLSELDAVFEGTRYVFTLGEDGQTIVTEFQKYDDTYEQILKNIAIGTGVILVCVTVSVVTAGAGAPAVSLIFAASAKTGTVMALSSGLFSGVTAGVVTGIETGDFDEAMKAAALAGSDGFKWGAFSGVIAGGATETVKYANAMKALKGVSLNGLTTQQAAAIQMETGYPVSIIKQFHSMDEFMVYKNAGLQSQMVGGQLALVKDIDLNFKSDLAGTQVTNLERMRLGYAPIDPATGKAYQLHHIGQKSNATLAVLTEAEHQGNASILNIVGKETEIDRNAFAAIRKQFWMDFAALFV